MSNDALPSARAWGSGMARHWFLLSGMLCLPAWHALMPAEVAADGKEKGGVMYLIPETERSWQPTAQARYLAWRRLPQTAFARVTLEQAVDQLREILNDPASRDNDPPGSPRWCNIVLRWPEEYAGNPNISLDLKGEGAAEILSHLTELSGFSILYEKHAVVVRPDAIACGEMATRLYKLNQRFAGAIALKKNPRPAVMAGGENLPNYTTAEYFPKTGELMVRTYSMNIASVDHWLIKTGGWDPPAPPKAVTRADKIVLKKLELHGVTPAEAVRTIQALGTVADPADKGIPCLLSPGPAPDKPRIHLSLRGVTVLEAMRYASLQSNYLLVTENGALILTRQWPEKPRWIPPRR